MFNAKRLLLAKKRRFLTAKALAELAGISPITLSRIENGETNPDHETVKKLCKALEYPVDFFLKDDPETIDVTSVSFRSLSKMSARERDAAISAGDIGLELSAWVEERFNLPEPDLIDLSNETDPEVASKLLRQYWGIGEKPIGNMLHLLEAKGIRVFSLSENTASVDAYSFWRNGKPFIFLNNFKTPEHSIMDAAHELGHLVLHKHSGTYPDTALSRNTEREANQFASAFLMPLDDLKARIPRHITTTTILKEKFRWRVSAMALAYRLNKIGNLTDWQYKSICIELGRRGYRKDEPDGIDREISSIWQKILTQLWAEGTTKNQISKDLCVPIDELENLIWSLTQASPIPDKNQIKKLFIVK